MKNRINIENYEAFLLDYMEGTISTEDLVSLQMFAAQHPHLNIDLNDLELVELNSENVSFEGKQDLKKISDEQFVAYIENQLGEDERNSVEELCAANTALAKDLKLYQSTIATPDETIIFENKNSLKKQETKVIWLFSRQVLAAAASLVLLFGLWFVFKGALTNSNLNSGKIEGIGKIKTVALKNIISTPSFTTDQEISPNHSNNPVVHTSKKNSVALKEEDTFIANNIVPEKDTASYQPKQINPVVKEDLLVNNSVKPTTTNTNKAYVITEKAYDEDEKTLASNNKKGFWGRAINALNGLHKLGVKQAKGAETVEHNDEQYVLTMGNFKLENHKYNAN